MIVPVKGGFGKTKRGKEKKAPVFYNPKMKLNRDLCCSLIRVLSEGGELIFLDLLAGSGAKGLRVANETNCKVYLNDANPESYAVIQKNAKLNDLEVEIFNEDANRLLQENCNAFDFIDIDPFGTPTPFLDNVTMTLRRDGFMGVTATDTAPLCGVYPMACFRKYGARPLRSEFCHEVGLRILIGNIARTSAKYSKGLECLLSHYMGHYFRTYVRLLEGREKANRTLKELGYLYYCGKCLNHEYKKETLPSKKECSCGSKFEISGPLWLGKLGNKNLYKRVLVESRYLENRTLDKLLSMMIDEEGSPFYYDTHHAARIFDIKLRPIDEIIEDLKTRGFKASRTHFSPTSVKTNARIEDVIKAFSRWSVR